MEYEEKVIFPSKAILADKRYFGLRKKDILRMIIGLFIVAVIVALAWILFQSSEATIVMILCGCGTVYMVCRTDDNSRSSIVDYIQNIVRFFRGAKHFRYRREEDNFWNGLNF